MSENLSFGGEFVWQPAAEVVERSHLKRFMNKHKTNSYDSLMDRSTQDVAWFTDAVLRYLDIQFQEPYKEVVDLSTGIQRPRWCVGGKLNIAHNCVEKWAANPDTRDNVALIYEGEEGQTRRLTYGELALEVHRCANALRSLELGKGDSIGIHMPMTPEIIVATLAIAAIGGIILPLFSGYGVGALATRLADAGAKALFTADGFPRRGKIIPLKPTADKAITQVSSVEHVIVLQRVGNDVNMVDGRDIWWHEFIPAQADGAVLETTDAEDVIMIIYTSGTTGKPKGAVHTHCGFPVKAAQDMAFGTDVHPGDVIYWMTDMGWMMGPWLLFGATLLGATFFIYLDTYWSTFKDIWVHGDWAVIDEDGMWYILGRSDDTIKVAGRRLGPAEVESVLVNHPAVNEAAAIGVPHPIKGSELICYCVLEIGHEPSEALGNELRAKVATEMGKPLQPKQILFASDLPKTRNAKVMRRIIRSAYLGENPGDTSSLVNPEIVGEFSQS